MAEGSESSEEKKHDPSARRQEKAREEGQVARAPDVIKFAYFCAFFLIALLPGGALVSWIGQRIPILLSHAGSLSVSAGIYFALTSFAELSVLLFILALVGALAGLVPGGWNVSSKALGPDFTKLSPAKGIKNMFSPKQLTETLKSLLKFIVVGGTGYFAFLVWRRQIIALPREAVPNWMQGLHAVVWIFGACTLASAIIIGLDTPLQTFFHRRKLRMTDKEMRDEQKETNVDPHIKSRQKQAQARAARARMMEQVPQASAVVVNPEHYAVAFRYRRHQDNAPVVIITGAGRLAQRICKLARRHGIPIVTAPPLARALYFHATPGETIPTALYQACAEILAYVWRLHAWASGQGREPTPPSESDLGVDKRLDPHAQRSNALTEHHKEVQ